MKKNKPLIAIDLSPLLPGGRNGGLKLVALTFCRQLVEHHSDDFRFLFLSCAEGASEVAEQFGSAGEHVIVSSQVNRSGILPGLERELITKAQVRRVLARTRSALMYSPFGILHFFSFDIPIMVTIADLLHRDLPQTLDRRNVCWREQHIKKMVLLSARIQTISEFSAGQLRRFYPQSGDKIFVTHLPLYGRLNQNREQVAAENAFFYPANFWPHKNHATLLRAYQIYRQSDEKEHWKLWLTGQPNERMEELRHMAEDLQISRDVLFLGYLKESEIDVTFRRAGALVFPSLYEGFGMPLVEAMYLHKPIICGSEGSIPEVVGPAGVYVDVRNPFALAEALNRVASDAVYRAERAQAAHDRLAAFSLKHEVTKLVDNMRAAIDSKPRLRLAEQLDLRRTLVGIDLNYYSHVLLGKR